MNGRISKETAAPTEKSEAIPEFGINVRIDNTETSAEDYQKYFRWRFQQRAVFFGDSSADHPRMKISVPSKNCTVGNEVTYNGETLGTRKAVCPDYTFSYNGVSNEKSFNGPTMNGEYNR